MHHHRRAIGSDTQRSIPKLNLVSRLTLGETRGGEARETFYGDLYGRAIRTGEAQSPADIQAFNENTSISNDS